MFALTITPIRRVQLAVLGCALIYAAPMAKAWGTLGIAAVALGFAAYAIVLLRAAGATVKPRARIAQADLHPVQSGKPARNRRLALETGAL